VGVTSKSRSGVKGGKMSVTFNMNFFPTEDLTMQHNDSSNAPEI